MIRYVLDRWLLEAVGARVLDEMAPICKMEDPVAFFSCRLPDRLRKLVIDELDKLPPDMNVGAKQNYSRGVTTVMIERADKTVSEPVGLLGFEDTSKYAKWIVTTPLYTVEMTVYSHIGWFDHLCNKVCAFIE